MRSKLSTLTSVWFSLSVSVGFVGFELFCDSGSNLLRLFTVIKTNQTQVDWSATYRAAVRRAGHVSFEFFWFLNQQSTKCREQRDLWTQCSYHHQLWVPLLVGFLLVCTVTFSPGGSCGSSARASSDYATLAASGSRPLVQCTIREKNTCPTWISSGLKTPPCGAKSLNMSTVVQLA